MQTFLPYADFADSSAVLDTRRLGKQRVETFQILRALTWPQYAWKNHPAVRMWRGFVPALVAYGLANCEEWTRRGYADSVRASLLAFSGGEAVPVTGLARRGELPPWLGVGELHRSHRSALLRKDPAWYGPWFGSGPDAVPGDLPYWWPPDLFPRWPVRAPQPPAPSAALGILGFDGLRPGQVEVAAAAAAGRDCLAVFRPGSGGSSAALLAGLAVAATTLRVLPGSVDARYAAAVELPEVIRSDGTSRAAAAELTARAPGPAELAAMAAETRRAPWRFAHPDQLAALDPGRIGLIVAEDVARLETTACGQIVAARARWGRPPLLALTDRADAARRTELSEMLDLSAPVHAGGGWDVPSFLDVRPVDPAPARRLRIESVRAAGPALVLAADRTRADRLVAQFERAGLRAAAAVPGMRAARIAAAAGQWRTRRLDALVLTGASDLTATGRVRPALLLGADAPDTVEAWRDLIESTGPERATLIAEPGAPAWAHEWAATPGCLRAWLLDRFGEPASPTCGRCARESVRA